MAGEGVNDSQRRKNFPYCLHGFTAPSSMYACSERPRPERMCEFAAFLQLLNSAKEESSFHRETAQVSNCLPIRNEESLDVTGGEE